MSRILVVGKWVLYDDGRLRRDVWIAGELGDRPKLGIGLFPSAIQIEGRRHSFRSNSALSEPQIVPGMLRVVTVAPYVTPCRMAFRQDAVLGNPHAMRLEAGFHSVQCNQVSTDTTYSAAGLAMLTGARFS